MASSSLSSASLLRLQANHISSRILSEDTRVENRLRKVLFLPPDSLIVNNLIRAGFYNVALINRCEYEIGLIRALLERWRPETHTFHFPCSECTITLEDIAIQLGLPIDGRAVTGGSLFEWGELLQNLLGVTVPTDFFRRHGSTVTLTWLRDTFHYVPTDATEEQIEYATRAYILRVIGGMLMPDKSSSRVHLMYLPLLANLNEVANYSWGLACLAFLYRELCRATIGGTQEIGGCLMLLQSWAWYRLQFLAPLVGQNPIYLIALRWCSPKRFTHTTTDIEGIRARLDRMGHSKFIWRPYISNEIMTCLPPNWYENSHLWRANTAIICFQIVEWHQANMVLRQFGMQQPIPQAPVNLDEVHNIDMCGNSGEYWPQKHSAWIKFWKRRSRNLTEALQILNNDFTPSEEYINWFYSEGRPFMFVLPGVHDVRSRSHDQGAANPDPPIQLHRRGQRRGIGQRRNQPSSIGVDNVIPHRMSFSHPKPDRDLGISSSHRHSVSHNTRDGNDNDMCYRSEIPVTRLDANLLTPSSSTHLPLGFSQFATPEGTGTYGFFHAAVAGSSSSGLGLFDINDINTVIRDYQEAQEATEEEEVSAVQLRGRGRTSRSVRGNEIENVERRVLPQRNRRAPHYCSTPHDRAPFNRLNVIKLYGYKV